MKFLQLLQAVPLLQILQQLQKQLHLLHTPLSISRISSPVIGASPILFKSNVCSIFLNFYSK